MIKRLTLTNDHLKLIPFFYINSNDGYDVNINTEYGLFNLNNRLIEDMCMILGYQDKAIPNTENDADGRAFDDETTKYMIDVYEYVVNNLSDIETLIHQFVVKGGLTPGVYKCLDNEQIWEKENNIWDI